MDKTINKFIIGFIILVIFDTTSFTIEKNRFGMFQGVIKVVSTVKQTIGLIR